MQNPETVLRASGLEKVYGSGKLAVRAVDSVSLALRQGELVLIAGPSGSGKTTLLSMLGGLLRPTGGSVSLGDQRLDDLAETELAKLRASHIGFVFQSYNLLSALSVEDNVLFPSRLAGAPQEAARRRARELIAQLGLEHRRRARPRALSGGEQQRAAVARALINDPPLILADEPTGNLDSERGQEVAMLLHDLARDEQRAVVIVTHDPRIEDIADRVLWLEDGKVSDRPPRTRDWGRDPVCGMRVDRAEAKHRAHHEAEDLVFCSARCRDRFLADPEVYLTRREQRQW